jgi:hypothetical protein
MAGIGSTRDTPTPPQNKRIFLESIGLGAEVLGRIESASNWRRWNQSETAALIGYYAIQNQPSTPERNDRPLSLSHEYRVILRKWQSTPCDIDGYVGRMALA